MQNLNDPSQLVLANLRVGHLIVKKYNLNNYNYFLK